MFIEPFAYMGCIYQLCLYAWKSDYQELSRWEMPSDNFEWQADDEQGWEAHPPTPGPQKPINPQRRWIIWLSGLIFLTAISLSGLFLLNRRANEAVGEIKQDVLATHNLLQSAIETNDFELFESLLSDLPPAWSDSQTQLMSLSLLLDRTSLGLEVDPSVSLAEIPSEIELEPDLSRAEVVQNWPYISSTSAGITTTIDLKRTFLYDLIDQQWRLTSLENDNSYWDHTEGEALNLIYTKQDAQIGRRFAPALDALMIGLCAEPEMACPPDVKLELKLDPDEFSIFRLSEGYYSAQLFKAYDVRRLTMPAPSLIGKPVDEAGYQALYRGYAGWLGAAILNQYVREDAGVNQSDISKILAKHDLQLPPRPKPALPRPPAVALPTGNFAPKHDVLMLCAGGNQQRLLRYKTAESTWENEWLFKIIDTPGAAAVYPQASLWRLPDYSGAVVTYARGDAEEPRWITYLWQDGQEQLWFEDEETAYFWQNRFSFIGDSRGRFMSGYHFLNEGEETVIVPWWIDIEACRTGQCRKMPADGAAIWSPDGRQTLLIALNPYGEPALHLGDRMGHSQEDLGDGFPVSWIDNEAFAYLRQQIPGAYDPTRMGIWDELVLGRAVPDRGGELAPEVLIDTERLRDGLPAERSEFPLGIVTAMAHDDGWLVGAKELSPEIQSASYLFYYQPQMDDLWVLLEMEQEQVITPLHLNKGERFLGVISLSQNDLVMRLLDLEDGRVVFRANRFPYDWSADGQWLLFVEDRKLSAFSPELEYEWTLEHQLQSCYSAVWIDRES